MTKSLLYRLSYIIAMCCTMVSTLCSCEIFTKPDLKEPQPIWTASLSTGELIGSLMPIIVSDYGIISLGSRNKQPVLLMFNKQSGKMIWEWDNVLGGKNLLIKRLHSYRNFLTLHDATSSSGLDIEKGITLWSGYHSYSTDIWSTGFGQLYFFRKGENIIVKGDMSNGREEEINIGALSAGFIAPTLYIDAATKDTMLVTAGSQHTRDSTSIEFYFRTYLVLYNLSKHKLIYQLLQREGYGNDKTGNLAPTNVCALYDNKVYTAIGKSIQCNNIVDGSLVWRREFSSNFFFSRIVEADGKIIGNGDDEGVMYALDAKTGAIVWETKTSSASGDILAQNGVVYMIGLGDGKLHAIDIVSGKHIWKLTSPDYESSQTNSFF